MPAALLAGTRIGIGGEFLLVHAKGVVEFTLAHRLLRLAHELGLWAAAPALRRLCAKNRGQGECRGAESNANMC